MPSQDIKTFMSSSTRPSTRVLKPPRRGHTNIFGPEPEVAVNAPRPKYHHQNSSNVSACTASTDANVAVEKLREEITYPKSNNDEAGGTGAKSNATNDTNNKSKASNRNNTRTGRVPPGGYSSGGFW